MDKNVVVVIGGGLNALGIFRNIGRFGIDAICLTDKIDFACTSRYCKGINIEPDLKTHHSKLLKALERISRKNNYNKYVLFPVSDVYMQQVSTISDELPSNFLINISDKKTIDTIIDKAEFYSYLSKLNIPHPKTYSSSKVENLKKYLEQIEFPVFLKPHKSHEFQAKFNGKKGLTINSFEEFEKSYNIVDKHSIPVMLNEIIPGDADNHFFIEGYCDKQGHIKAIFSRRRIHMNPYMWGNSTSMVSIAIEKILPAFDDLKRLLHNLQYRGIFSAEIKYDYRDKLYKFIEINARSWKHNLFPSICGVNIIKIAYDDLLNDMVDNSFVFIEDQYHIDAWPEIKSLFNTRKQNEKKLIDFLKEIKLPISFSLFSWDDPYPVLARTKEYSRKYFSRKLSFLY